MPRAATLTTAILAAAGLLYGGVTSLLKRPATTKFFLYAGTYTGKSKGIYAYRFDAADGSAEPLGVAAELTNPSFLAIHPQNGLLYAVSDVPQGTVSAYAINRKTGALRLLNKVSTHGEGPCHVVVDGKGWMLAVANFVSGNVASFRIAGDGSIADNTSLIQHIGPTPHPHQVEVTPDNFFLFVPDLGLDKVFSYRFDAARAVFWPNNPAFAEVKAGGGPRHLAFRPDEKFAYAVEDASSQVTVLRYDKLAGSLTALSEVSALPEGYRGVNHSAEIEVDAAGKFLYVSNRGDDSIAVFSIHLKTGELTKVQRVSTQGKGPRSFKIDPTGRYLLAANQDSGSIASFQIDRKTGMLSPSGKTLEVPSPVCLRFVPAD